MNDWTELAESSYAAATRLFRAQNRSCVSRCYYAVYSETKAHLVAINVSMPATRGNPSHASLSNLILNALAKLPTRKRVNLEREMRSLYRLRLAADFQPRIAVDDNDARVALGAMANAFRVLKELR